MLAEETRWVPFSSPFWTCIVKGEATDVGTVITVV